jgi:outer membrane protein TolC
VDLVGCDRAWGLPDFDNPAWMSAAEAVGVSTEPDANNGIQLNEAVALALYGNPGLRRLRLDAGVAQARAEYAGVWPDPVLGIDLLNVLDDAANPWTYGVSLGFTVPLSGRLTVAQRQADAETLVSWHRVAQQEWELIRQVQSAWIGLSATQYKAEAVVRALDDLSTLSAAAERLAEAGEVAPSDARLLKIAQVRWELERQGLERDLVSQRLAVLRLMGLRPDAGIRLNAVMPSWPAANPGATGEEALDAGRVAGHPAVRSAMAEYVVAERMLEREVRKQYPDLTIGPAFEREDGQSKFGLGAGVPLPLWNANRGGIAEARAARQAAQAEVESAYQDAAADLADAVARRRAAETQWRTTRDQLKPLVDQQVAEVRRLLEIGEVDLLLLNEALSAAMQAELALIEAAADRRAAAIDLNELLNPRWTVSLPPIDERTER